MFPPSDTIVDTGAKIRLHYAAKCVDCGRKLRPGKLAGYYPNTKQTRCWPCETNRRRAVKNLHRAHDHLDEQYHNALRAEN